MQFGAGDDDVVLPVRIVGVQPQRIARSDKARIGGAELPARAREAEAPRPLLPDHLDQHRIARRAHIVRIDEQARRQQRHDAQRGAADQPEFELVIDRLVGGTAAVAMAITPDHVADEQVDADEEGAGDDDRDGQRVVHLLPVGRERRRPPRAQEVEEHRSDNHDHECDGERHIDPSFCAAGTRAAQVTQVG